MMASAKEQVEMIDRIRALEDRLALNELVARYCTALDDCDFEALAELFTEDASFGSATGGLVGGRDVLLGFIESRARKEDWSFHYPHTHVIDLVSEDRATGVVTMHAEMGVDGGRCIRAAMRYKDEYVRIDRSWKFQKRLVQFWYCMDLGTLANGFDNSQRKQWPYTAAADLPESLETWQRSRVAQPTAVA